MTASPLAVRADALAAEIEADQATSWTGDDAYAAALRLRAALDRQLAAAHHIRAGRAPRRRAPAVDGIFGPSRRRRWWAW